MTGIIGFQSLEPGLYQVALPGEMQVLPAKVTLREDDHFWTESKNRKTGKKDESGKDEWEKRSIMCHTSTTGLLVQSAAIGAHVHSQVVELDRNRVRVVARGYCLRTDGLLEVVEKSKEYDLNAELFKAALKEAKARGNPTEAQGTALAKVATEETALALVNTLPVLAKARIMEARMEVQTHREALCRTKAENMCHRYFIAQAGGILKHKPGFGTLTIDLQRPVMARKLESSEVRQASEALFGTSVKHPAETPATPDPPPNEDAEVIDAEASDVAEDDAAAEEGGENDEPPEDWPGPADEDALPEDAGDVEDALPIACQAEGCENALSEKVVAWCRDHSEEFGGLLLCFDCQKKMQKGGKA